MDCGWEGGSKIRGQRWWWWWFGWVKVKGVDVFEIEISESEAERFSGGHEEKGVTKNGC